MLDITPSRSQLSQQLFRTEQPLPPLLREEDECPICHGELPPKGPDGSETARESHIVACIESNFSSGTRSHAHPPPETAILAAAVASPAASSQAAGTNSSVPVVVEARENLLESPFGTRPGNFTIQRRRTTGMVVYHATEKDCIGEDGVQQECVICFEEFIPGVDMSRLECLCKFHKVRPP